MTLNGVMAIILSYFAEFGSFRAKLRKSGIAINRFSYENCHKVHTNYKHDGRAVFSAVAELFVSIRGLFFVDVFSEHELTFTFAICRRPSVRRLSSVCNVRAPYLGN